MNIKLFLSIITLCLFVFRAAAQNAVPDSLVHDHGENQVVNSFNRTLGEQSEILNGPRYYLLPPAVKGSPYFFGTATFEPAVIQYNSTWYKEVPVLYDAYTDLMVSAARDVLYTFRSEKLSDIYLAGHHFVFKGASSSLNLSPGYYDLLYNGAAEVIVKRSRSVVKRVSSQSMETLYENNDVIYIRSGDNYLPVGNKHSVLRVLKNKTELLKQYISANKLSFGKDKEGSIVKLAAYYDKISR